MPTQTVAACASGQAVVGLYAAAFLTLNDVVNLPVASQITLHPASCLEDDRVATKMAVTFGLLPDES
jgi:hypothetical protein